MPLPGQQRVMIGLQRRHQLVPGLRHVARILRAHHQAKPGGLRCRGSDCRGKAPPPGGPDVGAPKHGFSQHRAQQQNRGFKRWPIKQGQQGKVGPVGVGDDRNARGFCLGQLRRQDRKLVLVGLA